MQPQSGAQKLVLCHLAPQNPSSDFYKKTPHFIQNHIKLNLIRSSNLKKQLNLGDFFFFWDSFHAKLNSHCEAWGYKKKKHKKIGAHRKSAQKEPTVKRRLLILELKPLRSYVRRKHSIGREFQSLAVRGNKLLTQTSLQHLGMVTERS